MPLADAELIAARAAIAAVYLDALPDPVLGEIQLREDQRNIVARAERALARDGGCMIAEDVGRGKTFIALAIARRWTTPLVVIPASLRSTWSGALRRARVPCAIITHEALSRNARPCDPFDAIIVDESHHFRTLGTRRHDALAELCSNVPIVLLTATPLQNRVSDLHAQLALYLGEAVFALEHSQLSRFVIRGVSDDDRVLPTVAPPEWITPAIDDSRVLRALLDLSPPAPLLDGGDAGVLTTLGLVRAWASSRAALRARLASRRRLASAIEQGVEAGRAPTRREAREWHGGIDAIQLGFASLLMNATPSEASLASIRSALDGEWESVHNLEAILRETPDPDEARVRALRGLRSDNPGHRILAFSEFASTIAAYYRALRRDAGVGMLTARQSCIASGRIGRDELLARFAPVAQRVTHMGTHEAVTLLLTTDLLAEGVNLQDASIVVHLDLPWNPARLAQRVGRVRRPGGASVVRSFLLAPPAEAVTLLEADARLRRKIAMAERVVGATFDVMPTLHRESARETNSLLENADAFGAFASVLAGWRRPDSTLMTADVIIAAVCAERSGWLAALSDGRVVAQLGNGDPDDHLTPLVATPLLDGAARTASEVEIANAEHALETWLESRAVMHDCGVHVHVGPLRHRVLMRLNNAARTLPRHARAEGFAHIARLREVLRYALPLGVERLLAALFDALPDADDTLTLLAHATSSIPGPRPAHIRRGDVHVNAIVLIGPRDES